MNERRNITRRKKYAHTPKREREREDKITTSDRRTRQAKGKQGVGWIYEISIVRFLVP